MRQSKGKPIAASGRRPEPDDRRAWLPPGIEPWVTGSIAALLVGALVFDELFPRRWWLLALVVSPMFSAVLLSPRRTLVVAGACTVLAIVLPESLYEHHQLRLVRATAIVVDSVLAVAAAAWRERMVQALVQAESARSGALRVRNAALELNDTVLQQVVAARSWVEMERWREAARCLDQAVGVLSDLLGELLGPEAPSPGDLVRGDEGRPLGDETP